jgi:hypothetical protein
MSGRRGGKAREGGVMMMCERSGAHEGGMCVLQSQALEVAANRPIGQRCTLRYCR